MITKEFLQEYPLLRKLKVIYDQHYNNSYETKGAIYNLPRLPINMNCKICDSSQTFNMEHNFEHYSVQNITTSTPVDKILEMRYLCASCKRFRHVFYIEFGIDTIPKEGSKTFTGWIRKIGQSPSWEIKINKKLEKALGKNSDLYKKRINLRISKLWYWIICLLQKNYRKCY